MLLLPGSRGQEIEGNIGSILRTAAIVKRRVPEARFAVAALHERHARRVREVIASSAEYRGLGIAVEAGKTQAFIAAATMAVAVSGSVSL